jgi:glutaminyl-tRNA synthetase
MRNGEFPDGTRTLRAKIDMASPNLNLRDPIMYRILHASHPRTGDAWCIYPTYDWAHGQSDAIEGITHSLCTLEFEDHRPLYDWFLEQIDGIHRPRQIEFARLEPTFTIVSKRKLLRLVEQRLVQGWDDPRMPTLAGLRRRGIPPRAIRELCAGVGITKYNSRTDIALLENFVRGELNRSAPRFMGVMRPLKVVIENYPEDESETLDAVNNPEDPRAGTRQVPFSRELYIERDDFLEDPPRKFFRLAPGREVRLRWAYFVTCTGVVKDASGEVTELRCTYDPETRGGDAPDGRKVKGTIHWVSARHSISAEVRMYDRLFSKEDPDDAPEGQDFTANLNTASLTVIDDAKIEPGLAGAEPGLRLQFERKGYFCVDPDSSPGRPVFNLTVPLRDSWAKLARTADTKS